jgi:hypothetical protein
MKLCLPMNGIYPHHSKWLGTVFAATERVGQVGRHSRVAPQRLSVIFRVTRHHRYG